MKKRIQLIPTGTVNQMFLIKNEIIQIIKGIVKDNPIKEANIAIFENNTGEPLIIKDVYLDSLENTLSIRTANNERKVIENVLEEGSEDMESIILNLSELTKIISFVENKINAQEEAKETISKIANEFGIEVITIK